VESIGVRSTDEAGLRVWLDRWVLVPGEHSQQEMAKGLDEARMCAGDGIPSARGQGPTPCREGGRLPDFG